MRSLSVNLLTIASLGITSVCSAGEVAREWLDRMHEALDELNYVGSFVRIVDGEAETLRVTHRYEEDEIYERIILLDGVQREIIRHDDELRIIYPDQDLIRFEKVLVTNPMVAALPSYSRSLEPNYELRELGSDRVAGRDTQVISISPRDDLRYGYLLWLDWETAMPLRSQSWNEAEQVIEEIVFTDIAYPETLPDTEFSQTTDTAGYAELYSREPKFDETAQKLWSITELPDGFELVASMLKSTPEDARNVEHMVYSDGLATVSVFVDSAEAESSVAEGFYRVGSTNAYCVVIDERRITAVGEVPPGTVEAIANSLRVH